MNNFKINKYNEEKNTKGKVSPLKKLKKNSTKIIAWVLIITVVLTTVSGSIIGMLS